jgi:hypothetical protein
MSRSVTMRGPPGSQNRAPPGSSSIAQPSSSFQPAKKGAGDGAPPLVDKNGGANGSVANGGAATQDVAAAINQVQLVLFVKLKVQRYFLFGRINLFSYSGTVCNITSSSVNSG